MALDLSSIRKAVDSLERAVKVSKPVLEDVVDTDEKEVIRAGVIQNFEFTYELCWKFIKRWLEQNFPGELTDAFTIKELYRIAAEHGLIEEPDPWFVYHSKRNKTSHIYDAGTAKDVYEKVEDFLKDAKQLLETLEERND